jgi:hypothetical protein
VLVPTNQSNYQPTYQPTNQTTKQPTIQTGQNQPIGQIDSNNLASYAKQTAWQRMPAHDVRQNCHAFPAISLFLNRLHNL